MSEVIVSTLEVDKLVHVANAETVGQYARQKVAAVFDTARSIANTALLGEMDDNILGTQQNTSDSHITAFLKGIF